MLRIKPLPDLNYLEECFTLDPTCPSGLRWLRRPTGHFPTQHGFVTFNGRYAGKPAGSISIKARDGKAYYALEILTKRYPTHRIVYSLFHRINLSTDIQVDHIDDNGINNEPNNLRLATHSENKHNFRKSRNNTSGFKGVSWSKTGKYWWGKVVFHSRQYYVRGCPAPEKAHELLLELRESLHKEFTNHG